MKKNCLFLLFLLGLLILSTTFSCQNKLPSTISEGTTITQRETISSTNETEVTTFFETQTNAKEETLSPADGAMALKAKVYAVLDTVNFDKTRFVHHSYFPRIGLDNEADLIYETYIQPLGIEAIPYILQYVLESPYSKLPEGWSTLGGDWPWIQEFWDSCYFVASAYALLDIPHSQDWYGYTDWYTEEEAFFTVRLFASQLYEHLPEHIDSDPAYWGTYTPAEGAPDPDETLPPVIYTDPKV